MADEDDLPLEAGAEELDASVEQDETPEPIINLASEMGWVPKDQYRGDPERWKPADQFIKAGRDIQQSTARELRSMREQMERLGGVTTQIVQDKVAERDAYWRSQFNQAVEEGDTDRANKLIDQRPSAPVVQDGPPPETREWIAKHEWFTKDPLAQARAVEICERLKHLPVAEQLAQAERGIRKEFPEHFASQAKPAPGVQTGMSRKAAPSNRVKGFLDMPPESQRVAIEFERTNGLKREDFAAQFWTNANKKRMVG